MSLNRQTYKLPDPLTRAVAASLEDWKTNNKLRRLWEKDASLWSGADESNWLGWLTITEEQLAHLDVFEQIADDVKKARFKHALLLGMGGSSLCPEVLRMTFGKVTGYPELHVLDSTDPAQVKAIEKKLDLKKTLCIVSSKSGSTLEPNIFKQYFYERIRQIAHQLNRDMIVRRPVDLQERDITVAARRYLAVAFLHRFVPSRFRAITH